MELPSSRETVLHFFDGLQKAFPQMTDFDCRESGEYVLEEDREQGSYRWVTLESRRLCTGYVNPPEVEAADTHHERVLEMAPYHLDFSPLDCEALDVLFAFDFVFTGNHDEVVAEALGLHTTFENLLQLPGSRVINYEPSVMLALDESCRLQCRLNIETRTNAYQVRTHQRLLHGSAILGQAAAKEFRGILPEPAPHLPGVGRQSHHPRGDSSPGADHRGEAVRRPTFPI
jgi:hypothetical protein